MIGFGLIPYRRWSTYEDAVLLNRGARPIGDVARELGRSRDSALGRWFRLRGRA